MVSKICNGANALLCLASERLSDSVISGCAVCRAEKPLADLLQLNG